MPAYTYILTNPSRTLYVGMTDDLSRRVFEHKTQLYEDAFTTRYRVNRLAYYECLQDGNVALARERQLKGCSRAMKIALVERVNPHWLDLADRWYTADELANSVRVDRAVAVPNLLLPGGAAKRASPAAC